MRCPNCGNEAQEDAVFCDQCGTRLRQPEAAAPARPATAGPEGGAGGADLRNRVVAEAAPQVSAEEAPAAAKEAAPPSSPPVEVAPPPLEEVEEVPASAVTEAGTEAAAVPEPTPSYPAADLATPEAHLECPACGAEVAPGDAFCEFCGAALTAAADRKIGRCSGCPSGMDEEFFERVRAQAEAKKLLSREHFSCDGTLLEAAASLKSFRATDEAGPKDDGNTPVGGGGRNPEVDFRGERRANATHASTTDPEARLAKKGRGKEAKLAYAGHILVENRHGLIVDCELTQATGTAEPEAAALMLSRERSTRRGKGTMTVGADRGYNTRGFVQKARALKVTPHVAQKQRYNAIDGRTMSHEGYQISQRRRKIVEEPFGWMKTVGGLRKLRHRGTTKVRAIFTFTCACFNLVRLRNLGAELCLE